MVQLEQVTVIGVGLLGGSFALSLKRNGFGGTIRGAGRSRKNLNLALERKIVDKVFDDPEEAVRGSDLVLLATPLESFLPVLQICSRSLKKGAVVTDVGSVKGGLVRELEDTTPPGVEFVGSHPIAGGEEVGAGSARDDLFEGMTCVLTPTERSSPEAVARVASVWEGLGARIVHMDAYEHDEIYGVVSHMPHVVAYALAEAVLSGGGTHSQLCGRGFRDVTRIAASSPEVWRDILRRNQGNVVKAMDDFQRVLQKYRKALEDGDWSTLQELMEHARSLRKRLDGNPARDNDAY